MTFFFLLLKETLGQFSIQEMKILVLEYFFLEVTTIKKIKLVGWYVGVKFPFGNF
jgi:hypothetical protein